jgi:hypothetical protein
VVRTGATLVAQALAHLPGARRRGEDGAAAAH